MTKSVDSATPDSEKNFITTHQTSVEEQSLHAGDMDEGAKFLFEHPEHADYTPAEAKKVLRKIDWMLMPIMTIVITLAAADKIIISNAAVYGMSVDINLKGTQYSWLGSIFYFGYLLGEFPANFIIQRYPVAKVLGASFVAWNIVLMCMAAGNNFASMAVMRFLLGIGESFLFPSCAVITGMFYTKAEQPFRTAIWFSGFSSIVTGILSYAVGNANVKIANWRLLFIVFSSITLFFTAILLIVLPDSPIACRWFTDRERYIAVDRTKENRTGTRNTSYKKDQIIEAAKDWKTYCMAVFALCINISNGALVTFAAQIVSGLGYSRLRTVLLGMPTGVFMTLSSWIIAAPTLKYPKKYRTVWCAIVCCCPLICCVLMMKLDRSLKVNLLIAYYFFYFYWGPYVTMTALSIANTSGLTKKTVVNATNFTSYCISNIIAPQFFMSKEAPTYATGYHAILGFTAGALASIITYGSGCYLENKRRDKLYGPAEDNMPKEADALDLTDKQKEKYFRYVW